MSDFLSQKRSKLAGLRDLKKIIASWTLFDPNYRIKLIREIIRKATALKTNVKTFSKVLLSKLADNCYNFKDVPRREESCLVGNL